MGYDTKPSIVNNAISLVISGLNELFSPEVGESFVPDGITYTVCVTRPDGVVLWFDVKTSMKLDNMSSIELKRALSDIDDFTAFDKMAIVLKSTLKEICI